MKKRIEHLIFKHFDEHLTDEEAKELVEWIENGNHEKFNAYTDLNFSIESTKNKKNQINPSLWKNISSTINNPKPKIRKLHYWRYIAAASIVLLFATTFLTEKESPPAAVTPVKPKINKDILIGTDKATLTLEDGSSIVLEKGKSYTTHNIKSNGEKVTYKSVDTNQQNSTKLSYNYLTVPRGGQFFIELEDGTSVWLNSESQLKYPTAFLTGKPREVELIYGEAYFDVSPSTKHQGATFKVLSNEQEVEVLGTEFNIKAYQDETFIYTTLVEGKVLLDNKIQKEYLNPNQQLVLNKETKNTVINKVDVSYEISWKDGIFSFKSKPLKDIMKVLSRWYDVDFTFLNPKLETTKYIGVLSKDQELEEILSIIKNTNFINAYEIKENTILIK